MANFLKGASLFFLASAACLFFSCAPAQVVKKPVVESMPEHPVRIVHGDTLNYQIAFSDSGEHERFIYRFNQFLKQESFLSERFDSAGIFTSLKILPSANPSPQPAAQTMGVPAGRETQPGRPEPPRDTIAPVPAPDTARPPLSGSLRIYLPRSSIEYPFSSLVQAYPFRDNSGADTMEGYFSAAAGSGQTIVLQFAGKIVNGRGTIVTALDIIDQWTRFTSDHPAEAYALFTSCEGINGYIRGQEAVVKGFQAVNDRTIRIRLSRPDPLAIERLQTMRALPWPFRLGTYFVKTQREQEVVLAANPRAVGSRAFLKECSVRCGGDNTPMVSFSLGRYDAVMLSNAPDLDYARRNLLKNGTCSLIGRDRYFIAALLQDSLSRACIRSLVSPADLLRNVVKAEGSPLTAIESDSSFGPAQQTVRPGVPAVPATLSSATEPLKIMYRKDDAISKTVAEKLLAALTHAGARGALVAADGKQYESSLASREWSGCAVGWAPETVVNDKSEKLRLATIFFNDETDEGKRVGNNTEIPLFSVDWYLLAKRRVGLYQAKLTGLYVKQAGDGRP